MEERYSNQNLAGLLSEALGLEPGDGRASFSGPSRETFRRALEAEPPPETFEDLLAVLESQGSKDRLAVDAVREQAEKTPNRSLQEFAADHAARG